MAPAGLRHGGLGAELTASLHDFVRRNGLGLVTVAETGFIISRPDEPDTVLAPDVAFIASERVPAPDSPDWGRFPRLVPDLVAEIASPSQYRPEMEAKVRRWLDAGARLVWVFWPLAKEVDIWTGEDSAGPRTLRKQETMHGEPVLPGFELPLATLWE